MIKNFLAIFTAYVFSCINISPIFLAKDKNIISNASCFLLSLIAFICFSPSTSVDFICFSHASTRGEYVNLACSIILPWSGGNASSPTRYSYLSILHDDRADIFAASLLISYYIFSDTLFKIFFLKCKGFSDARVVSISK